MDEALHALALTHSDGDETDPATLVEFKTICDTLKWEKEFVHMTVKEIVSSPSRRRRLSLAVSVAIITMLSGNHNRLIVISRLEMADDGPLGNNIVSYYLGSMLDGAGITDSTTQLKIVSPNFIKTG